MSAATVTFTASAAYAGAHFRQYLRAYGARTVADLVDDDDLHSHDDPHDAGEADDEDPQDPRVRKTEL